ncbi:ArsA family ATPase [Acidaminobacter sp. JC074]|uniref:ArsA family ATPase n=1 Tax=Acidaminobacter sp. JC074 TaxID=2530199 RepID=UPI001F1038B5|nr:ArsA family ATPase [Acidaminobacter sp. JC074]MCH4889097.1 ArsA family ATPase [Acidaminobacter sp. JC074]
MSKILFFGGKGGVGKTSCSSAFAVKRASEGHKVLLVSTDPAHSTSDLFERKIGPKIVPLRDNLDALEIDPQKEADDYIKMIKGNMSQIVSPIILDEMNQQLDAARVSPGSHESALFDKMIEIINKTSADYDYIIFDTAPTGHTVRLLSLPEMLGAWMDTLLRKRRKTMALKRMVDRAKGKESEQDPIIKILMRRKENLEKARHIMMDEKSLSFVFVMNAERLPIEETKKAVKLLKKYQIPVQSLVVNRILPESKDEFWKNKKLSETKYLEEINESFDVSHIYKIPMFQSDMKASSIDQMADYFRK